MYRESSYPELEGGTDKKTEVKMSNLRPHLEIL
jgi:hypothetical protein